jgi:uncharacterized phiE125 gp8 family phage protein
MKTVLVTAPATIPVTAAEVKTQIKVTGTDDDAEITRLISVATLDIEQFLCRKLITQTWKVYLDYWPAFIKVPFGNLQSVTHVKYTDTDRTQTTLSTDYYDVDTVSVPGQITLKYGQSWPSVALYPLNPIEIQFVTGFGAATTNVPEDIRHAIMWLCGHMDAHRELYLTGTIIAKIPHTFDALAWRHRVWEWCL